MFLKNGKTWIADNKDGNVKELCPFDNAKIESIYSIENITGYMTELPQDLLPQSFKQSMPDSFAVFKCKQCQKTFMRWENGDWDELEFHEVKILPDGNYSREGEAVNTEDLKKAGMQDEWVKENLYK